MGKMAGDPLRKVTLNLFDADVEWFQRRHGQGYSEIIRAVVHKHVKQHSVVERSFQQLSEDVAVLFNDPNDIGEDHEWE